MRPEETRAILETSLDVMLAARAAHIAGTLSEDELRVICTVTQQDIDRVKNAHQAR